MYKFFIKKYDINLKWLKRIASIEYLRSRISEYLCLRLIILFDCLFVLISVCYSHTVSHANEGIKQDFHPNNMSHRLLYEKDYVFLGFIAQRFLCQPYTNTSKNYCKDIKNIIKCK